MVLSLLEVEELVAATMAVWGLVALAAFRQQ